MTEAVRVRLWKPQEVADYLGVSLSWVYLHVSLGDLPHLRVGGLLRFLPEAVQAYARGERAPVSNVVGLRTKG